MISIEDLVESIIKKHSLIPLLKGSSDQDLFDLISSLNIDTELTVVLEEILINAREHGLPPVQIYGGKIFEEFYFGIWDLGPGIHNTIPNNKLLSDTRNKSASALIRLSCEEGITGTGVRGRGIGLFLLSTFCKNRNAECLILSDGGYVLQIQDRFLEKPQSPAIQGTLICLKVKL